MVPAITVVMAIQWEREEPMKEINTIGLDIAKNVFEVCCEDGKGNVVERRRLRRAQVLAWFAGQTRCVVGLEACGGAHHWARKITELGFTVRIVPPQYVTPHVRTNKSDAHDAHAILRALREPDLPTVAIASRAQQDIQALHRVRVRLIKQRTALSNQIRGLLLEDGIAIPKRIDHVRKKLSELMSVPSGLSHTFLTILEEQAKELAALDERIERYNRQIEQQAQEDPAGRRVMGVLGIGGLTASALVLKVRHASAYKNGRHFAASLGLVPKHEGTGGKIFMRGMSKRGDRYLRTLLIHGARAVVSHVHDKLDPLSLWLKALIERRGTNKAVVALANKNARIAWHLIVKEEVYDPSRACAAARAA